MRMSVGFVSLGCPKNLVDTERMIQILGDAGAAITGNSDEADVIVINTCGFLEAAKQESLSTIDDFVQLKKKKELKGVVVAGCMTERYLHEMKERYPEVDAFIQVREFSSIADVVSKIESGDEGYLKRRRELVGEVGQLEGHSELPDFIERTPGRRSYAYVKIAEGCNRTCSFCIIPKLRGKLHSRSVEGIVDEAHQLATQGVKEVILIAQDLTSYGRDRSDGANLLELLKRLDDVDGIEWIRLNYNYPRFFTDELIAHLATSKRFARYLDIPFQHIAAPVLARMRRPESPEEIRSLVKKLKDRIPDLSLRTTMMVGFPGETEKDFDELLDFVEEGSFDHLGAFKYCREEGTPSYALENQVSEKAKDERYHRLMVAQKKVSKRLLREKFGKTLDVMIDGFAEKTKQGLVYRGRHRGQAPDIDGITYVLSDGELAIGSIIPVAIHKSLGDYDLLGSAEVAHSTAVSASSGG